MLLHICSCILVSLVYCKNIGAVVTSLFYEDILKTFGSCGGASLIVGLEYGKERWNGKWNGTVKVHVTANLCS